jgi:hypothetical protein
MSLKGHVPGMKELKNAYILLGLLDVASLFLKEVRRSPDFVFQKFLSYTFLN